MIAEIIVDISTDNVDHIYEYLSIEGLIVGDHVLVPFGNKQIEGFCIKIKDKSEFDYDKLKSVNKIIGHVLIDEQIQMMDFLEQMYNLRKIDVIRLFIPSKLRGGKIKEKFTTLISFATNNILENFDKSEEICLKNSSDDKFVDDILLKIKPNANKQLGVYHYLKHNTKVDYTKLCAIFGNQAVNTMLKKGWLREEKQTQFRRPLIIEKTYEKVFLNNTQTKIIDDINKSEDTSYLIHGVTGSGKTEVYMNVIKACLDKGKTAIMLVPEISLTSQMVANFYARFGETIAIIHSALSDGERFDEWRRIKEQNVKIVIGVRSAIFSPLQNIGVIIIDEEHDSSYYSENNPRYYTHEVAKFRAKYNKANLILGSATPSIESYYKAKKGEYKLLKMPERIIPQNMPEIKIVDMNVQMSMGNTTPYSYALQDGLKECLENKNQAMIFLNRRGYSSYQRCSECGYIPKCDNCDVSLVLHKEDCQLKCHYCGKRYRILTKCPKCGSASIKNGAMGTQRIEEDLLKNFNCPIFRLDNDTNKVKDGSIKVLSEFGKTKPAVLVGTQMIAKGHDFKDITFVGIIDADLSLHFADYKSCERTFQLITQVSGRAGRGDKKGKVVLQTFFPKHYVYRLALNNEYEAFYEKEIALREVTNFPPFANIVRILISGQDELKVKYSLKEIYDEVKVIKQNNIDDFIYLEAMNSPIKRIQNKYRYQILMRYKLNAHQKIIKEIYSQVNEKKYKNISIFVEINSQNLN